MKRRITHPRKALWIYHCELCNHLRPSTDRFRAIESQQTHERGRTHQSVIFQKAIKPVAEAFRNIFEAFQPLINALQDIGLIEPPPPADPRDRALWHKQHQGRGPELEPLRVRGRVTRYRTKG